MHNDQLVSTACPIIQGLGSAFYFTPATLARGKELGLNGMQFYVLGRGGVLGDVEPAVVHSAFGYFNPSIIERAWGGSSILAPRAAAREYIACCAAFGREKFAAVPGLGAFVAAAEKVNEAADPVGLALYAGIKAEPMVEDLPGRAMQLVSALREFRGSAHLIALRASGIPDRTAHYVKRPNDVKTFGWSEDDAPEITDATRAAMDAAEALTDRIVAPAYAVLDDAGAIALLDGLNALKAAAAA